jgi:D-alanyl-lipoteichoic acid acyltransferase DltB (MBOAT superfamily)
MFVFILSGFWHGAGWTFLIWGALHGIFYLFEQIFPVKLPVRVNNFNKIFRIIFTFTLVNFAWIFFRSESVKIAYTLMKNSFVFNSGQLNFNHLMLLTNVLLIGFLLMVNIIERKNDIISYISEKSLVFRWSVYYIVIITIFLFGNFGIQEFIYFRF